MRRAGQLLDIFIRAGTTALLDVQTYAGQFLSQVLK
jgi:hypothetical protein